jgi:hypothetical protein
MMTTAQPDLDRVLVLTDAMLAATRAPDLDLKLMAVLLDERGKLLGGLSGAPAGDSRGRLEILQRVQAADAEIRSKLADRQNQVATERWVLNEWATRQRIRQARTSRSNLVDLRA